MDLTPFQCVFLFLVCFFGSAVSGLMGFAGGMVMLAGLAAVLDTAYIVPIHAAISLGSNLSRIGFFFKHIRWEVVRYFVVGLILGSILGLAIYKLLPKDLLKLLMGIFILIMTYLPQKKEAGAMRLIFFIPVAFAAGILGMLFGGTGPFTAPFFFRRKLIKESFIATAGATQTLHHFIKLLLFGLIGSNVLPYWRTLLVLYAGIILGTWSGKKLLGRVSEKTFKLSVYTILTLLALDIIIPQVIKLWPIASSGQ